MLGQPGVGLLQLIGALALVGAVVAAVHHAEVVAHRVGEPLGTLVLALAITVIEVALIVSLMLSGGATAAALPRDTLYATVMIICNGVIGACLLVGGLRHREQSFQVAGTGPALAALVVLCTIALVMPVFTTSSPEGTYTEAQLVFVGLASSALWAVYVFVQTVSHRDYFLPASDAADESVHAQPPTRLQAGLSALLLPLALVAVVGLAKALSPLVEGLVNAASLPKAVVGIVIALVVLMPETWAALRAARANRLQTSMNLALGSALASIGLTVPAVVVAATWLDLPLVLGLAPKEMAMLAMTFLVSAITLGTGRTHLMQGAVHLVVFAAFVFLAFVP
ncbi:Putative ionic transporter y4hA [Rubrivivax sp. A210]|nr:ionic transporter y4hA [Rubrivivax sp. A210]CAD5373142.1 Putative ionic transporter y4hA [Rubrivivax sp. A210]